MSQLKSLPLCRNILRALSAADLPDLEEFPRADRVTFRYYTGTLHFLASEYTSAETHLRYAFANCHYSALSQQAQILLPLLPLTLLLRGSLPSQRLLRPHPGLRALYQPFFNALHSPPSLSAFDAALEDPRLERILVQRGTYLAVETLRLVLLRQIIKRLWIVKGKNTRLALDDVEAALLFGGWTSSCGGGDGSGSGDGQVNGQIRNGDLANGHRDAKSTTAIATATASAADDTPSKAAAAAAAATTPISPPGQKEEVEWLAGGLIARGYIKGYISHERRIMVLSNTLAFPALKDVGVHGLL